MVLEVECLNARIIKKSPVLKKSSGNTKVSH